MAWASISRRSSPRPPARPPTSSSSCSDTGTDVVINYLPVGSETATKWYVEQILQAGCGFVNCIPVFIGREDYWRKRFEEAQLPIVGDDIKSQVGATIVHRTLARLFRDRGVKLERTMQLNVGGNTDFYNMLERERLESKKISKTNAVTSQLDYDIGADNVHIGPSDYVAWLTDRKWAYIRLEGRTFGDVPLNVELKLEVWDSPNSAGVVIDAVRCAKLAKDAGIGGELLGPSAYFMKSPAVQYTDEQARLMVEEFITEFGQTSQTSTGRDRGARHRIRQGEWREDQRRAEQRREDQVSAYTLPKRHNCPFLMLLEGAASYLRGPYPLPPLPQEKGSRRRGWLPRVTPPLKGRGRGRGPSQRFDSAEDSRRSASDFMYRMRLMSCLISSSTWLYSSPKERCLSFAVRSIRCALNSARSSDSITSPICSDSSALSILPLHAASESVLALVLASITHADSRCHPSMAYLYGPDLPYRIFPPFSSLSALEYPVRQRCASERRETPPCQRRA